MEPDFICIGAQKAGTTWLYKQLNAHPEFAMLPIKEVHYFDRNERYPSPNILSQTRLIRRLTKPKATFEALKTVAKSVLAGEYSDARWYAKWHFSNYSDDWYLSLFDHEKGKLTGEISPAYSILEEPDVRNMRSVVGNTKIIFLIRNPIDRAWSMMRFAKRRGASFDLNDTKAVIERIDRPGQELRSDYERTLEIYAQHFDPSNIIVGFYDAISQQPAALLSSILNHIGVVNSEATTDVLKARFNATENVDMPDAVRNYLVSKYRKPIVSLSNRFGGYATDWLRQIEDANKEAQPLTRDGELHPPVCNL